MGEGIAIVRFSKILVPRMPLITGWMQSLRSNQVIRPFSDYVMAPVPISLAAETLHKIAQNQDGGIFQVSGPNDVTYSDIAYHVAGRLNVSDKLISPVRVEDAGIYMDHNPRFTTLDTWRIKQRYGMKIPDAFSSVDWVFFHG